VSTSRFTEDLRGFLPEQPSACWLGNCKISKCYRRLSARDAYLLRSGRKPSFTTTEGGWWIYSRVAFNAVFRFLAARTPKTAYNRNVSHLWSSLCLFRQKAKSAVSALQIRIQLPLTQLLIGVSVRTLEHMATCFGTHSGRQILPYIL